MFIYSFRSTGRAAPEALLEGKGGGGGVKGVTIAFYKKKPTIFI